MSDHSVRLAPYIEDRHKDFLQEVADSVAIAKTADPYAAISAALSPEDIIFATGCTLATSETVFGSYLANMLSLDVNALWSKSFVDMLSEEQIEAIATNVLDELDDDFERQVTEIRRAARDINAVGSSSTIVAISSVERDRIVACSATRMEARSLLLERANDAQQVKLNLAQQEVVTCATIHKLYLSSQPVYDSIDYKKKAEQVLWPLRVEDEMRKALKVIRNAGWESKNELNQSLTRTEKWASMSASILGGAATGASIYGPYGAAIGAGIGNAKGVASIYQFNDFTYAWAYATGDPVSTFIVGSLFRPRAWGELWNDITHW